MYRQPPSWLGKLNLIDVIITVKKPITCFYLVKWRPSGYDRPLKAEMIQMMISINTITEMMPTAAPALKIPVITEQPLRAIIAKANNNKLTFLMVDHCKIYNINLITTIRPYTTLTGLDQISSVSVLSFGKNCIAINTMKIANRLIGTRASIATNNSSIANYLGGNN
jgi:hypothetical protein